MKKEINIDSLEIKDHSHDFKIEALNLFAKIKIVDYLKIANSIKNNNDLQRKRIANPSSVYTLLKEDLKAGCLIPSIVLALDLEEENITDYSKIDYVNFKLLIQSKAESLKILDGLQRTNILIDLEKDLNKTSDKIHGQIELDQKTLKKFYESEIRIEIYLNVSRFGILYRMLTLNTGQTPMSLRHQIEILYSDYYTKEKDGVILLRDAFENQKLKLGHYRFSDIVEGVTSYIDGSEFTLDRFDLLNYIKSLKKLSIEDKKIDIFNSFVSTYHCFLTEIMSKSEKWTFNFGNLTEEQLYYFPVQRKENDKEIRVSPFGLTAIDIFLKAQIFTGLGAAFSKLKEKKIISDFSTIKDDIKSLRFETTPNQAFDNLIVRLEQVRKESKKIGESQRTYFNYFFISLFNKNDKDSFMIFEKATESAFLKTT